MVMACPEDASIETNSASDPHLPARVQHSAYSRDRVFYMLASDAVGSFTCMEGPLQHLCQECRIFAAADMSRSRSNLL